MTEQNTGSILKSQQEWLSNNWLTKQIHIENPTKTYTIAMVEQTAKNLMSLRDKIYASKVCFDYKRCS